MSPDRPVVVVAGGGPAALEVLLTLSDRLVGQETSLCLVAPNQSLAFRPLSSVAEFATHTPHALALADVAARCEARLINDRVVLVEEDNRRFLTRDGEWIRFDHFVLAVGAQESVALRRWPVWGANRDPALLRALVDEIGRQEIQKIGVVVPAHAGWPLAGFELALILGWAAKSTDSGAVVWLLTADERPLEVLGSAAEAGIDTELRRAGVKTLSGVPVREPQRDEHLPGAGAFAPRLRGRPEAAPGSRPAPIEVLVGNERMGFDRLITLPASRGPGTADLAVDERGYVCVDGYGRMLGSERVWAAGDCTTSVVKHSTLAVAQADVVADSLAATLGAPVQPQPFEPFLRGILVTDAAERWWPQNMTPTEGLEPATHCLWWPPGGAVGGRLAHYIADRDPAARPYLLSHPRGTALSVALTLPGSAEPPTEPAGARGMAEQIGRQAVDHARRVDTYDRRVFATHRLEREAESGLDELKDRLGQKQTYSQQLLGRLSAAGYVAKDSANTGRSHR